MSFSYKPTREWSISCKDCKQKISKLVSNGHIVNDENGVGGKRNDDHVCPFRLRSGSATDEARIRKKIVCKRCGKQFYGKFVDCPDCFKLVCQKCGTLQDWRIDKPENTCINCGHPYLDWMEITTYDPITGKYIKKDIKWKPVIAEQVPQISDCETVKNKYGETYGHIYRKGDRKCRVCGKE